MCVEGGSCILPHKRGCVQHQSIFAPPCAVEWGVTSLYMYVTSILHSTGRVRFDNPGH